MKHHPLISIFLFFSLSLSAQHIEDHPRLLDSLLNAQRKMHFYQSPMLGRSDSVWHSEQHLYLYFDTDSICRQFIRKGGWQCCSRRNVCCTNGLWKKNAWKPSWWKRKNYQATHQPRETTSCNASMIWCKPKDSLPTRKYFHQLFHDEYGISSSNFRKMAKGW